MGHTPHAYVPAPWGPSELAVSADTRHHLEKVLRRAQTDVSYTDGVGRVGYGTYAEGLIQRAGERTIPRPDQHLTMAVAVPTSAVRTRMVVEKLAELGVDRLLWLETMWSQGRPPKPNRVEAWAVGALEQSQGAWLMDAGGSVEVAELATLDGAVVVADPGGDPFVAVVSALDSNVIVAVGPEGGFAPDEIPGDVVCGSLGERILRVETAAIVSAGLATTGRHLRGASARD